jgi:GH25 family lysozyme M1 (1,4-beta-N-acetylmuramidase)
MRFLPPISRHRQRQHAGRRSATPAGTGPSGGRAAPPPAHAARRARSRRSGARNAQRQGRSRGRAGHAASLIIATALGVASFGVSGTALGAPAALAAGPTAATPTAATPSQATPLAAAPAPATQIPAGPTPTPAGPTPTPAAAGPTPAGPAAAGQDAGEPAAGAPGVAGPRGGPDSADGRGPADPPADWPRGIDVSSWQHPSGAKIDWKKVRDSGVRFAIVKATEGKTYTNPYFVEDRTRAREAGLVVGAYHYARPKLPISTAAEQARHFLDVAGTTRQPGNLAPVLDLEDAGELDAAELVAWARTFMAEIETRTGRTPVFYTHRSFWADVLGNPAAFAHYPLWFAIHSTRTTPGSPPGGWQNWTLWQHSQSGRVPGISADVDLDVYCCTPEALTAGADGRLGELAKHAADPTVSAVLGKATGPERPADAIGGGRWQRYERGQMFWSVNTGAHEVHGEIADKYLALGGADGFLRRPLTDEVDASAPAGRGAGAAAGAGRAGLTGRAGPTGRAGHAGPAARQSIFEGGRIYWSRQTGAHEVHGEILDRYLELGGAAGLGLPIGDEHDVPGGRASAFQHGTLRWDRATGKVTELVP